MNIFKEIPPTAGFPLSLKDFLSILRKKNRQSSLEDDFKGYLNAPYAQITYSGTAALYLILESLKTISFRKKVIIPSYICPLVPLAIKRAGLEVVVCDINKDNFNFDIGGLEGLCLRNTDILAIVPVHLAGIPQDLDAIKNIAQRHKIFLIEDCAQSLGAVYKGKRVGSFGEFSFFSLCRGKGPTIYEGGVIVANNSEYASVIDKKIGELVKNNFFSETLKIFELFGYGLLYRPGLFWLAFSLPQIYWNSRGQRLKALGDYYALDFSMHRVSRIRKLIGHIGFSRLEKEIKKQRKKAFYYIEGLAGVPGIRIITEPAGSEATYPYLVVLFDDPEKRKAAQEAFRGKGLGVFQVYDAAITDYDYLKDKIGNSIFPNARYLAEREITLSTSTFLKDDDLAVVVDTIKRVLRS